MRISYKFRLFETGKNDRLHRMVTVAGRIRNHCVAFQRTHYRLFGKFCKRFALMGHIAKVRNRKPEWQIVNAQSVQAIIERLDLTYTAFFKWLKNRSGQKSGLPKFKRSSGIGGVVFKQWGWAYLGGNKIRFGKHVYKFVKSREIEGTIKTCTLKRDSMGRFWVVFSCIKDDAVVQAAGSTNTAGFDFGLRTFLTCSDGTTIESPQFFKAGLEDVVKCCRHLSSKSRGSKRFRKAKRQLARAHERIANRRRDWFYKLAHSLCDRFDRMYFEDLNLEGMKRLWGRKVSDLAFGEFLKILQSASQWTRLADLQG